MHATDNYITYDLLLENLLFNSNKLCFVYVSLFSKYISEYT